MKFIFSYLFFLCFAFADLGIDPAVVQGKLDNGLNYFVQANKTPSNKIELRLQIGSGSLDEEDSQQGLAHYIEHLAFNGSKNFPSGSLVKYFESLGLKFGRHQNAFTGFDQTTYTLSLPNNEEDTLDKGLLCLSDYAYRLFLDQEEINKERNIILEEKRVRSGAGRRFWKAYLKEIFPNSRLANRFPIGIEKIINNAKQKRFKDFYQKWYVPQNATVMVVGDVDPKQVEVIIKKHFSEWKTAQVAIPLKSEVTPNKKLKVAIISDEEFENTEVLINNSFLKQPEHTQEYYNEGLMQQVIHYIVNLRFKKSLQQGKILFKVATYNFNIVQEVDIFAAYAKGKFKFWKNMVEELISEIRRVDEFGFTIEEFMLSRKHFFALSKQAIKNESTRTSDAIISNLSLLVIDKRLPLSAQQEFELVEQFFKIYNLKDINSYFSEYYTLKTMNFIVKIPEKKRPDISIKAVEEVIQKSFQKENIPVAFNFTNKKLFNKNLTKGKVSKFKKAQKLPISSLTLQNNILINHYFSQIDKEQVRVSVTIPIGQLGESKEDKGIHQSLLSAFNNPATKTLNSSDLNYLLTGKNFVISAINQRDSVVVNLFSSKDDLEEGLQTLHLLLTESKLEEAEFKIWQEKKQQEIDKIAYEVESKHWSKFSEIISYNDWRFTSLNQKELDNINLTKSQTKLDWLIQQPMEVAIVGDIEFAKAEKLSLSYFGSLSHRPAITNHSKLRNLHRINKESEVVQIIDSKTKKSLILFAWRFQDYKNLQDRLSLELAANIIDTKLNTEIREKLGLTYSINCSLLAHESLPERGMFYVTFSASSENSQKALQIARQIVEKFKEEPISEEQLQVSLKQSLHILERQQKQLAYWSNWLSGLNYRLRDYDFPFQKKQLLSKVTIEDVQEVLQKVLGQKNFISLISKSTE